MPLPQFFSLAKAKGFDPLLLAIAEYRSGMAAYNALLDCLTDVDALADAAADEAFNVTLKRLQDWPHPALSKEAAVEALTLGLQELANGDSDTAMAMMRAAMGFLNQPDPAVAA